MLYKNILLLGLIGFLSACTSTRPQSDGREPASIVSFPQVPAVGYLSSEVTSTVLNESSASVFGTDASSYQQLNEQLHEVDREVRTLLYVPAMIPVPDLRIVKDPEPNAFVMGPPTCIVKPGKAVYHSEMLAGDIYELRRINQNSDVFWLRQDDLLDKTCVPQTPSQIQQLGTYLSSKNISFIGTEHKCSIDSANAQLNVQCDDPHFFSGLNFQFTQTMPVVFVTAGLIASLRNAEEFQALVAHELGHYYLGHPFEYLRPPSYFYNRSTQTSAYRPVEDPSLKPLGDVLLRLSISLGKGQVLPQYYHSSESGVRLLQAMDIFYFLKESPDASYAYNPKMCAPFSDNSYKDLALTFLAVSSPSSAQTQSAKMIFEHAKDCLQTLHWLKNDEKFTPLFSRSLSADQMKILMGGVDSTLADAAPNGWSAFQIIDRAISNTLQNLHSSDTLRRLGYYTFEEEADVFAINYLRSTHRRVSALQDGLESAERYDLATSSVRDPETENCMKAYDAHWILNGKPYSPLPLDFSDPHHGMCFRLYNIQSFGSRLGSYNNGPAASDNGQNFALIKAQYIEIAANLRAKGSTEGANFVQKVYHQRKKKRLKQADSNH